MCCSEAFWKRVVVFGLTFGLGVFVAGLFISEQLPASINPTLIAAPPENKNCVPLDKNLKYEHLTTEDRNIPLDGKERLATKKQEDKKKSSKAEQNKQKKSAAQQYYDPSKDSAEFKELLHKERCFETPVQ